MPPRRLATASRALVGSIQACSASFPSIKEGKTSRRENLRVHQTLQPTPQPHLLAGTYRPIERLMQREIYSL